MCLPFLGCGEAPVGTGTSSQRAQVFKQQSTRAATRTGTETTGKTKTTTAPVARPHSVTAKIDVSSDKIIAEGKIHIATGAPSDAEVRHEIELAKKAGVVLPKGDSAASFENSQSNVGTGGVEVETPIVAWNPRSKPIATWIIPVLEWASKHGWAGSVTSGYRTFYEQAQLNAAGAFSAPAGLSNHETSVYPGGAVDVTQSSQLIAVLRRYTGPMKLVGGVLGAVDPEHFSATGD